MLIGGGISWSGWYGINQGNYQRFLAVPSRRQSRMYYHNLLYTVDKILINYVRQIFLFYLNRKGHFL